MTPTTPEQIAPVAAGLEPPDILILASLLDTPYRSAEEVLSHTGALLQIFGRAEEPSDARVSTLARLKSLTQEGLLQPEPTVGPGGEAGESWRLTGAGLVSLLYAVPLPVPDFTRGPIDFQIRYLILKNLRLLGRDARLRRYIKSAPSGRLPYAQEAYGIFGGKARFQEFFQKQANPLRFVGEQVVRQRQVIDAAAEEAQRLEALAAEVDRRFDELMAGPPADLLQVLGRSREARNPIWEHDMARALALKQVEIELCHVLRPHLAKLRSDLAYLEDLLAEDERQERERGGWIGEIEGDGETPGDERTAP